MNTARKRQAVGYLPNPVRAAVNSQGYNAWREVKDTRFSPSPAQKGRRLIARGVTPGGETRIPPLRSSAP